MKEMCREINGVIMECGKFLRGSFQGDVAGDRSVPSWLAIALILVVLLEGGSVHAQGTSHKPGKTHRTVRDNYVPTAVWVKLKPQFAGMLSASGGRVASLPGVASVRPLVPGATIPSGRRGPINQTVDITRYHTLLLEPGRTVESSISSLLSTGYFDAVEPIYNNQPMLTPDDPSFGSQAYLNLIRATDAWDITQGDENIVIGIVDTGGDLSHPDLTDKVYIDPAEPIDGIDNNGDGYVDNARGWDFSGAVAADVGTSGFVGDNDPSVPKAGIFGHGTMVAGCAGASTNNGVGIASVGNRTKLLFTKHFSDDQDAYASSYSSNTYLGVLYAATHGARIINCSWGSYNRSTIAQDIINYVTLDLGCLVLGAAGNSNLEAPIYPASYDNVLSVGSTTINDERTYFSNYGGTVDIMATGDVIYTTQYKDSYVNESGTSLSTPIVSGAAALVWAMHPEYSPLQVAEQLRVSADASIYDKNPAYLHKLGFGRLDVFAALTKESPSVRVHNEEVVNAGGNAPAAGETALLYLDFTNYLKATSSLSATISTSSSYATVIQDTYLVGALGTGETRRNNNSPFTLSLAPGLPLDEVIEILVTISDGSYEDHQLLNFSINSFIEIRENNIITSLSPNARIGYGAPDTQSRGSGFLYNEEHLLYEMGLVVGTSSADLQNNVRIVGTTYDDDFVPDLKIKKETPGQRSYSEISGSVISANDALGIGYRSLVWNENPDRNFIIIEYTIENRMTVAVNDLYFGLFADWDIADQGAHDRAGWDAATRLGYVFPMAGVQLPRAGIQVLTGQPQYRAIDNDQTLAGNPFGIYDGFTHDEKFTSISEGVARTDAGTAASGGDVSHTVGSGPYSIAAGGNITIAFALHAAMSQDELIRSAQRADTVYNYTLKAPVPVVEATKACNGLDAVLRPTGAGTYHLYRSFTGGAPVASGTTLSLGPLSRDTVVYVANADNHYESLRVPATVSVVSRPQVVAEGPTAFCVGGKVVLDVGDGNAYRWSSGEETRTISVNTAGTFSAEVQRDGIFCPSTNSETVVTYELPDASFTTSPDVPEAGGITTFTANEADATTWAWQIEGTDAGTGRQYSYTFEDEGVYTVRLTVTNSHSCSRSTEQEVGLITGIESGLQGVTMYPNPVVDDRVQVSLPSGYALVLEVFDALGRKRIVLHGDSVELSSFSTSSLHNGQYILRITSGNQVVNQKFVVSR